MLVSLLGTAPSRIAGPSQHSTLPALPALRSWLARDDEIAGFDPLSEIIKDERRGSASLGAKQLELLGPGHFFRRPSSLHLGCTILDRMIRDDQRDGIVIAAEQCEEAPPRARRPEVRGEFTIDFRSALLSLDLRQVRLPIDKSPGGERRLHLLALLARHLEHRAVAPCMDAGISPAIEVQKMLAADVPQERPVHFELARTGPHRLQHRRQIQISHSASSSNRAATKRPILRAAALAAAIDGPTSVGRNGRFPDSPTEEPSS